jgi:hypothetical protein
MQQAEEAMAEKTDARESRYLLKYGQGGPAAVFIVGMHGNEPAAVKAVEQWLQTAEYQNSSGSIYVLIGNKKALSEEKRFIDVDLNRIWSFEHLHAARQKRKPEAPAPPHEYRELLELEKQVQKIIAAHKVDSLYFFDLHTTSSDSVPFLPFNDTLANRKLASQFDVPLVLGIEEYLDDTFMSHINDLNHPAVAFEAGQHLDPLSVKRHICFIRLVLHHLNMLELSELDWEDCHLHISGQMNKNQIGFFDIRYRHHVHPESGFKMLPGFRSFSTVKKGQVLARDLQGDIISPLSGMIFMPLYQEQGQDGFFVVKKLSRFWLGLSRRLREWGLSDFVPYLPGIRPHPHRPESYTIPKFLLGVLGRKFLHLMGYRVKIRPNQPIWLTKRD